MANCKDNCIHYKVCMYGDLTEYKTEQILKDDCDDYMSKDVVPKSEVESTNPIQEAIEQKKKENKGFALGVLNELLDEKDAEIKRLEYTLAGVMHSVDKWLDGEELEQDEVNRAATMREKTLRIIENAKSDYEYLKKLLDDKCDRCIEEEKQRVARVAREIFKRIHNKFDYFKRYREVNDIIDNFFTLIEEVEKKYTENKGE